MGGGHALGGPSPLQDNRGQLLADLVVKLPRNPQPFTFLRVERDGNLRRALIRGRVL